MGSVIKFRISNGVLPVIFAPITALVVFGTSNSVLTLAALALCIVVIIAFSHEDSLCLLMYLLPFSNVFKMSPNSQSFFTYLMLFYVLFVLIVKRRLDKVFLVTVFSLMVLLLVQSYYSFNALRLIKIIANLFFIYVSIDIDVKNHHKKIFLFYIFGVLVSSIVANSGLIRNLDAYIGVKDLGLRNDWLIRFSGLYGDPNYYAVNVIVAMCLLILLLHKKEINPVLAYVIIAGLVYFSVITYSKSAFLMLIIPAMFLVYSTIRRKKYLLAVIFVVVLAVLLQRVISGQIDVFDVILKRFKEGNGDATTGRIESWKVYYDYFRENTARFAFGSGLGAEVLNGKAPHNTYIDFLYYFGLFGTVIFALSLFAMPKPAKKENKTNLLNFSVIMCIAVMYMFLSEIFYVDLPFQIILAIIVLYLPLNYE